MTHLSVFPQIDLLSEPILGSLGGIMHDYNKPLKLDVLALSTKEVLCHDLSDSCGIPELVWVLVGGWHLKTRENLGVLSVMRLLDSNFESAL